MKKINRILLALLLIVSVALSTACGFGNSSNKDTSTGKAPETGSYIYRNGYCDYVLLVPENPTPYEASARDEFLTLFSEATSYNMEVVTDTQGVPKGKNFISLGDTLQLRASGISATERELGYSGYKIVTKDNNVYISGDVDRNCPGTLYGVYGLLNECFNFKAYSASAYRLDKETRVPLRAWNIKDVPDIDMRSLGYLDLNQDAQYANRLRVQQWNGSSTSNEWVTNGHSQLESLMNPSNYRDEHPDWYWQSSNSLTLCYTNPEVVEKMAERVMYELGNNTVAEYFMIGQSDTNSSCACATCSKRAAELGGSYSAVQLEFINKVSDIVTPWLEETQPGREMTFYIFAYWWSLNPPGLDESGNRYVYARDNVGIMYTPLNMNYRYPIDEPQNSQFYSALQGWNEVTDHLTVYYYPVSFHNYILPFNDFGALADNIRILVDMGCEYYYTQGNGNDTRGCAMQDLRAFVQAQLLWDCSQNVEDLVKEFNTYYFKDAANAMQRYYDLTRSWYEADINGALVDTGKCGVAWGNENAYPKDYVDFLESCMAEALVEIEHYKETDPELYEELYWRIEKERLTVTYLNLKNYTHYYSSEQIYEMAVHFQETTTHFNIVTISEGGTVASFLQPFLN